MQDSEKQIYYDIITRCWKTFTSCTEYEEFSDIWWEKIIAGFDEIIDAYKNTEYMSFVNVITMKFIDEHERRKNRWKT